jgi:hypothetical protein
MTTFGIIAVIVLLWLLPIFVAQRVGHSRFSFLWGLLGWIGVASLWLWWRPIKEKPQQ